MDSCGAPVQGQGLPASVDLETETVIQGTVVDASGSPVDRAFVRLPDSYGEFTAEVVSSADGAFQFFASPGSWTLRALSSAGNGGTEVAPHAPGLHEATVQVAR